MRVKQVSFSSDRKLARCEQQFSYRYDDKLKVRVKSKGLYMGAWLHDLYEPYYRRMQDGPKSKLPKWEQVHAKMIKDSWDKLFEEERENYTEDGFTPGFAKELMEHYVDHWGPTDSKYKILHIEKDFSLDTKFGFPIVWKSDLLVQDGKAVVLIETKNKKEIPNVEDRLLAVQPHSYAFLHGKKGIKIDRIVWNYIRTAPIPSPKLNKDGTISKAKINTDRIHYLKFLKDNKIHPKGDEVIGVENILKNLPETLALLRVTNAPNLKVGEMFVRDWITRARRAQQTTRPTRHFIRDCRWGCDYYKLCLADMMGKVDRNTIIKKDFFPVEKLESGEELK